MMTTPRPKAQDFRDLSVWQAARRLVVTVYATTRRMPRDEIFGLTGQMRRAAVSVASNIAEGWGRGGRKELHRYCSVSRGELYELESLIDVTEGLELVPPGTFKDTRDMAAEVSRMLSGLRKSLRTSANDS